MAPKRERLREQDGKERVNDEPADKLLRDLNERQRPLAERFNPPLDQRISHAARRRFSAW
jgi:hypothetical protein